ncbi:hypothetical protein DB41_KJ00090 [Neochlamydia sp. TUME1]|uniref:UTP--glucose-1-phosphate uridylyltransferase n=1 Tax=Neochlamydia sp. TUME1 TaxID=1478174 RepID=UPI000583015A|nr:UTP--glucose-1-phosphate uridylyltransferase [Neochlamydia sp. TUME1]KIC72534.1 hypothetical protein DB41_KJ00090 [Neochlamydia sp. TUME1]
MSTSTSAIHSIKHSLKRLKSLTAQLKNAKKIDERLDILNRNPEVQAFLQQNSCLKDFLFCCNAHAQVIIKSLLALGQGPIIFQGMHQHSNPHLALNQLIESLAPVENFYAMMGGLVGYHCMMLQLIEEKELGKKEDNSLPPAERYSKPPGYDISQETSFVRKAIREAVEKMPLIAEIYPVGGAGDRLKLQDEKTGEDLPSAELLFEGRTLLEGLIRDLQAREYLYYKLTGKYLIVPVAMMTSDEKNNYRHVFDICKRSSWFGRPQDTFDFFKQPLVPVLTKQGDWAVAESMKVIFKPGGHGVIWKLAVEAGVIDRLLKKGYTKALVRQINNPAASTDYGLLAFSGCGILNNQSLGFASCPRLLNTAEGMNVLIEKESNQGYDYCISNIEYPDFVKRNIPEIAEQQGGFYSALPANTNILFVDLMAIKNLVDSCPIPGMLINMKHKVTCLSLEGRRQQVHAGRLESLMQNIADGMTTPFLQRQKHLQAKDLGTFVTYNQRRKTISVTKRAFTEGQSFLETPEGCYWDQLQNHYELFTHYCKMQLPEVPNEDKYIQEGPTCITSFHPALGPLYSVIAQKIHGGSLSLNSEMVLEISELILQKVNIKGSLLIYAENIVGHKNAQGIITYSEKVGRCVLKNVYVVNRGINKKLSSSYWKKQIIREESLKITLKGCSEFIAENVTLEGDLEIEVADGERLIAQNREGELTFIREQIRVPRPLFTYFFDKEDRMILEKHLDT